MKSFLSYSTSNKKKKSEKTYCIPVINPATSIVTRGIAVVAPISANCSAVLYLLIVVGRTSADGKLKSQYRAKVLGGGREM